MKTSTFMQVVPDSVCFRGLTSGDGDSCELWVTNISKQPRRIRFIISPRTNEFVLSSEGTIRVAPGLDTHVTLTYKGEKLKASKVLKADVLVECEDDAITIPVIAIPPSSRLFPDKSKIDLGSIGVGTAQKVHFTLTNMGSLEGTFQLSCKDKFVEILSQKGEISPGKACEVSVAIKPVEVGDLNTKIMITCANSYEPIPPVEVNCKVVSNTLSLVQGGKSVNEIDFGCVFIGQKHVVTVSIENRGVYKSSFVIMAPQDSPIHSARTTATTEEGEGSTAPPAAPIFQALQPEGLLNAYGSQAIQFVFRPPEDLLQIEDVESLFNQFSSIEVVETGQKIDFQMSGKSVKHFARLSAIDFDFGKLPVNQKVEKLLTITNDSHYMATTFRIKPHAHFRFIPMEGTIEPQKSCDVTIMFFPKNLGVFETRTLIGFCNGLFKKHINLVGTCGNPDEKPCRRVPAHETDPNAMFSLNHPGRYGFGRRELTRHQGMRSTFDGYITDYATRRRAVTAVSQMRSKARKNARSVLQNTVGQYTRDDFKDAVTRELAALEDVNEAAEDSTRDDLQPPNPKVSYAPTPLYLAHPEQFGLTKPKVQNQPATIQVRKKVHHDDNVMIKKKFKGKPTSPQEVSECTRALTPAQQLQVVASQQNIAFGQVSVFTAATKSFTITNNLAHSVLVTMNYEHMELSGSTPVSQVVAAHAVAGFDVQFLSRKPINFVKPISYTVNGHHTYPVNVTASATPIELHLTRAMIEFRFSPDSTTPIIKEFVSIVNKSQARAEFTWSGFTSAFSMSETSGYVEPLKMLNVEITYVPTTHSHDETTLIMNVSGGQSRVLKCIGDVGVPKCVLNKKSVNFGLIPIGIARTYQIRLKNNGDDNGIFTVEHNRMSELAISPTSGKVAAHDYQTLTLTYTTGRAQSLDIPVNISIAGAPPISFNVTGQSELPEVVLSSSEFEFGRLFVGSSTSLPTTISNVGAIPAILFLDLANRPEFRLEYSLDLADKVRDEKSSSISLVSDEVFTTFHEEKLAPGKIRSQASTLVLERVDTSLVRGLIYRIYVVEGSTISFNLVYQPTEVSEHSFELPITMMNVVSSSFHLQPIVSAEAIRPPISLSVHSINFGVGPLFDEDNPHSRPILKQLTLTSDWKSPLPWHFDLSNVDLSIFKPDVLEGNLAVATAQVIHIAFTPKEAVPYDVQLPIYVKTDKEESIIGSVQMIGMGSSAKFSMSTSSVSLPIVPLGVRSEAIIYVMNDAFVETSLRVQMSVDENAFPVKVTFPEGEDLHYTLLKIPVLVSFQANKPMSFSTMIGLVSDDGHATSFSVTCTTDNSVMTLYPLLNSDTKYSVVTGSGGVLKIDMPAVKRPSEIMSKFASAGDFLDLAGDSWRVSYGKLIVDFIYRYMNALVVNTQLSDFPNDFIKNEGALINEVIISLNGGKKLPTELNDRIEKPITEAVMKRRDGFSKLLHSLEGIGAMVAHVKPEFLMSLDDFLALMTAKVTRQLLGIDRFGAPSLSSFDQKVVSDFTSSKPFSDALMGRIKVLETVYQKLSMESWMFVLMQICKIFILGKIDVDRLNHTHGMSDAIKRLQGIAADIGAGNDMIAWINRPGKAILASTVYSQAEGCLLKWISVHACAVSDDLERAVITFESLRDSRALLALMKGHSTTFLGIVEGEPDDKDQSAIELTGAMRGLKLGFSPRPEEIANGTAPMLAMTTAYLLETAPHFLPLTVIEFATNLHKPITRAITVTNPSKAEILYKAVLEGNDNFMLVEDSISVDAGATVDFVVQFLARTLRPVTARLTLSPAKPRFNSSLAGGPGDKSALGSPRGPPQCPTFSSPIVVDLISSVTLAEPDAQYTVEGCLYQPESLTIPVKNPGSAPCKLRLMTKAVFMGKNQDFSLSSQITKMMNPEEATSSPTKERTSYENFLFQHHAFVFSHRSVEFPKDDSEVAVEVEFVPISLGTYRCVMLFIDEENGEYIVDVTGKSTLPAPVEIASGKLKTESGNKITMSVPLELINANLIRSLAYSIERKVALSAALSDRKFKDLLAKRTRDIETHCRQHFTSVKFSVTNSASMYFEIPDEIDLYKNAVVDTVGKGTCQKSNVIPIVFKPLKAGNYPCRIVLSSRTDIRLFSVNAIGLAATKELSLDFVTVAGRVVKQDIPLVNPSPDTWTYKISLSRESGTFSVPNRMVVKPKTTAMVSVSFNPSKPGTYSSEIHVANLSKESNVIYSLTGVVDEPPAEQKIVAQCQARKRKTLSFPVKASSFRNGMIDVTTTVPIITFNPEIEVVNGEIRPDFEYTVLAQQSGIAAGTITFTDPQTKNYVWFIIEISVSSPAPEQTLNVSTVARKCASVNIPISNPKTKDAEFTVVLSDEDLFGEKKFSVPAQSTMQYTLAVSPLKAMKRTSSVYFYSEDDGEFWYCIHVEASRPPDNALAPLSSPLGKYESAYITLENPVNKTVSFRIENTNQTSFSVSAKRIIQLAAYEKRRIEIKYIPTGVGIKDTTTVTFISTEAGEWTYNLTGVGKPPQVLSPLIVTSTMVCPNSALIIFNNPFPYAARFTISMDYKEELCPFKFLLRRKKFSLTKFGEELQIPFTFSPSKLGQFKAHIVVTCVGNCNSDSGQTKEEGYHVQWMFPIIGNALVNEAPEVQILTCNAHSPIEKTMTFSLSGEGEIFQPHEYIAYVDVPSPYEFLRRSLDVKCVDVRRKEGSAEADVLVKFLPMRPLDLKVTLVLKNRLSQEWQFDIQLVIERGKIQGSISVESLLNQSGTAKVMIPFSFRQQTPFHAYFVQGSASEFRIDQEHGFFEPDVSESAELPSVIVFEPKMYGKLLKGILVVDTLDAQFLFDVIGKTPEYVPPVVTADGSRLGLYVGESGSMNRSKKRNFIRENRNSATIAKPQIRKPALDK